MTIDGSKHPTVRGLEDFVAFELGIDMPQTGAQIIDIDALRNVSKVIGGREIVPAQPTSPAGFAAMLLKFIEAADATDEHGEKHRGKDGRGNLGMGAGIGHLPPMIAEMKDLFSVSEQSG